MDKNTARQLGKKARISLTAQERLEKSNAIVDLLYPFIQDKKTIGIYIPSNAEVDVTSLFFLYPSLGVPKVRNHEEMDFFFISSFTELEEGAFHLLEPISNVWIAPEDLEAIIIPLTSFDEKKHRTGQGKGYYDRYLAHATNALKIGVAFEVQKVDEILVENHDVTLDYIISEKKVY